MTTASQTNNTPRRRRPGTPSRWATTGTLLRRRRRWQTRRSASWGSRPASGSSTSRRGTGGLSLPAARLGAEVVATDWSPPMIEQFQARVRDEGLVNAKGRVMDCHALDFSDDSFDVTGSRFGVMLVPEQPRALREMVRVAKARRSRARERLRLARRARVPAVLLQRSASRRPRLLGNPGRSASARVPGIRPGGPAPASDRRRTEGGRGQRTTERPAFGSGQEMWDWVLNGNPIPGMLVADLTEEQQARLRQVLDGMLRERSGGNGPAVLTNAVNIGIGTK